MKITKVPSWLIIILCLSIGAFASFKAKQQLFGLEQQNWLSTAAQVNSDFLSGINQRFNEQIKPIQNFAALAISNQNDSNDQFEQFAESYLLTHPGIDEISIGYYQIDENRLSHQWSFGTASLFLDNDELKPSLLNLYRNAKQTPNQLIYQLAQTQQNFNPNLLAGYYFQHSNKSYFFISVIDLNNLHYEITQLMVPDHLSLKLDFMDDSHSQLFSWTFNPELVNKENKSLETISVARWHLSTQVAEKFNQGINTSKSDNIFIAGLILSVLIALFVSFLAILRYLSRQELQLSQLELSENKDLLLNYQENLKRSAKFAVYSQLAPKATQAIPPYISNVIKACSSLEEKGLHFKSLIKEKKATKSQYLSFLDNTVVLARGSAESMLKAGTCLFNLEKIKQELEQDSLSQVHLQTHLQDLVDTYKGAHSEVNFIITVAPDLVIETYPGSLTHLLTIFLNNSLEHGFKDQSDQVLMIEATFNKTKNRVSLRIEDNGTGIEPDLLEAINTNQPHPKCVGIGLSMAREIVEAQMHGELDIKSKYERYTRVSMQLPKDQTAQPKTESETEKQD